MLAPGETGEKSVRFAPQWFLSVRGLMGLCLVVVALLGPGIQASEREYPLATQTMTLNRHRLTLEVADTPAAQVRGLMFRDSLPPHHGMLFRFPAAEPRTFWMKHCKIPLDLIFLRQQTVIAITHNAPPCREDPCPLYPSGEPADTVIELAGGSARRLGLAPGQRLQEAKKSPHPKSFMRR